MTAPRRPSFTERLSAWTRGRPQAAEAQRSARGWAGLERLVEANDLDELVAALRRIEGDQQRRDLAAGWRAVDKRHRAQRRTVEGAGQGGWSAHERRSQLLAVAAAGLLPEAELATVLARQEWFDVAGEPHGVQNRRCSAVVDVVAARDAGLLPALAGRLAERLGDRDERTESYRLVDAMLRAAGAPPPEAEAFALLWMKGVQADLRGELARGPEWVRLLVSSLGLPGLGWTVSDLEGHVVELVGDGTLPRDDVLDVLVGRMQRPERPGDLAHVTDLYERLAPTPPEVAARAADLLAVLGTAPARACRLLMRHLRDAVTRGDLEARLAVDAAAMVLVRTEKALVVDQLVWLKEVGRAAATDGDDQLLGEVVGAATLAFAHPASDVQRRAADLVARRLDGVAPLVAASARTAAAALPADLQPLVATDAGPAPADSIAPPSIALPSIAPPSIALPSIAPPSIAPPSIAALPRPTPPRTVTEIETPAELAEEFSAVAVAAEAGRLVDGIRLERVLAGLAAHGRRDRDGLAATLGPVLRADDGWRATMVDLVDRTGGCGGRGAWFVWQALVGCASLRLRDRPDRRTTGVREAALPYAEPLTAEGSAARTVAGRVEELAVALRAGRPVPLVGTPTTTDGALDVDVLVDRLVSLAGEGLEPGPQDLSAALRRCPPGPHPDAARRLLAAGPSLPWLHAAAQRLGETRTEAAPATVDPSVGGPVAGWCLDAWVLSLPHDPDLAGVHLAATLGGAGLGDETASVLLRLAEAPGRPGTGVAAAVVAVLSHERASYRVAGLDALVALAARDPTAQTAVWPAVGAGLVRGAVPVTRFAGALADTARAGGVAPAWTTTAAALRGALAAAKPPTRLDALLAAAVEIAHAARATDTLPTDAATAVPGLAELAARQGSSRTVAEARRLRQALHP